MVRSHRRNLLISTALSLVITLLVWGISLTPQYSLSPDTLNPTLMPTCRTGGPHLLCSQKFSDPGYEDACGAIQEMPIDYYLSQFKTAPEWNPYIGSGYPTALDGQNNLYSPTRWLLKNLPGERGHDLLIFVRAFFWILGILLSLTLLGAQWPVLIPVGLGAALSHHLASRIDHVMLDVDLLAPWFLFILLSYKEGRNSLKVCLGAAIALGALAGSLGFLQAQFGFIVTVAALSLFSATSTRYRSIALAAAVGLGFLLMSSAWLPIIQNLNEFVSSRSASKCLAREDSIGWGVYLEEIFFLHHGVYSLGTFMGIFLGTQLLKAKKNQFILGSYCFLSALVILKLPRIVCHFPGISGVRFGRHLAPNGQFLFLFLTGSGAHQLSVRMRTHWSPTIWGFLGIALLSTGYSHELRYQYLWIISTISLFGLYYFYPKIPIKARYSITSVAVLGLALGPFAMQNGYFWKLLRLDLPPRLPEISTQIPEESPLGQVQKLSQKEDRRHFSSQDILYPNWSSAFKILDLRILGALYPKSYYALNSASGLYTDWLRDGRHGINPDRFVRPVDPAHLFDLDFQRILILNRVSLFTFLKGKAIFAPSGAYPGDTLETPTDSPFQKEKCRLLADSSETESYVCPEIGGIGYFPLEIRMAQSIPEALTLLRTQPLSHLKDFAVITPASETSTTPGVGKIISFMRSGNDLTYVIQVEKPGIFVISDTWFPGWSAQVNLKSTNLIQANIAFKAVLVPLGRVRIDLHFSQAATKL